MLLIVCSTALAFSIATASDCQLLRVNYLPIDPTVPVPPITDPLNDPPDRIRFFSYSPYSSSGCVMYSGNDALSAGLRSDSIFTTGRFFAIASVMISVVSIIILVMAMFITCCCSASTLKYAVGTLYMLTFLCQCIAFLGMKSPASVCGVIMIEQNLRTECSASTTVGLGAVASALYAIFVEHWFSV